MRRKSEFVFGKRWGRRANVEHHGGSSAGGGGTAAAGVTAGGLA